MVSQDVILFDDTIKNNIAYAKVGASDLEISKACKYAAADEFIKKLPNGYDTVIGENGIDYQVDKNSESIARAVQSPLFYLMKLLHP